MKTRNRKTKTDEEKTSYYVENQFKIGFKRGTLIVPSGEKSNKSDEGLKPIKGHYFGI